MQKLNELIQQKTALVLRSKRISSLHHLSHNITNELDGVTRLARIQFPVFPKEQRNLHLQLRHWRGIGKSPKYFALVNFRWLEVRNPRNPLGLLNIQLPLHNFQKWFQDKKMFKKFLYNSLNVFFNMTLGH